MNNKKILSIVLILCLACTMALLAACNKQSKNKIQVMDNDQNIAQVNSLKVSDWKVDKEGYRLEGFYTDKELTKKIDKEVKGDVKIVYANFKEIADIENQVELNDKKVFYDGKPHTLEIDKDDPNFVSKIEYKLNGKVIKEAINVGEYNVTVTYYSLKYATFTRQAVLTIKPINEYKANKIELANQTSVYTGKPVKLGDIFMVTGDDKEIFSYTLKLGDDVTEAINVGTYNVIATCHNSKYSSLVELHATLEITKADFKEFKFDDITTTPDNFDFLPKTKTIDGVEFNCKYAVNIEDRQEDTIPATVTLSNANYNVITKTFNVIIKSN